MKIRTIKHIFKEGITNVYRNKLMSLASISIVVASLTIFGIFYMIILNFNHNVGKLKDQPEMQVFCLTELDDVGVKIVEDALMQNEKIKQVAIVTKEQAFEKVKDMLGDNASVLEGIDNSFLPVSFIIKLNNPEDSAMLMDELEKINGVDKVTYPQKTVEFISKFTHGIQIVNSILTTVLLVVSVFIISNTIKLTVFARRREISIMKYIGATDWFIRWPFIVEGVIIGFIGSIVALLISGYGYNAVEMRFTKELLMTGTSIISILKLNDVSARVALLYIVLGCIVGASGSVTTIRKYLKV
ncbi:MAG TPA: permease-like cell division protein FtsX [Clostridiales bacterium]|mgnify:CR=1 FL=1|nr:permease-like cell division protein FtsX [Clostridiales bacterium]